MHRSTEIYGPDATAFRPERWEDDFSSSDSDDTGRDNAPRSGKVSWAYLPFNGGPRVCLGQEFALLEASYATVRLLQVFTDIQLVDGLRESTPGSEKQILTLVLASANGCNVNLSRT